MSSQTDILVSCPEAQMQLSEIRTCSSRRLPDETTDKVKQGSKHACPLSLVPETTHMPWPLLILNLCRISSLHSSPAGLPTVRLLI